MLVRRGVLDSSTATTILEPPKPPDPCDHFPDLAKAIVRLQGACQIAESVAICGDYDADGMTSTALLMVTLKCLGAQPIAAIPNRKSEGYGLNRDMVTRLHEQGIRLIVTVDNGVTAQEALQQAENLSMEVILTDHHTLPDSPLNVLCLLHPSVTPQDSPYRCLAGVGLAYLLASSLAEAMDCKEAIGPARDLFCIGTVADMAPLTGANRAFLREGLNNLHRTRCKGLRALQRLAGIEERPLKAEDIGFQLAPRINAVGRLGDPQLVVKLLTVDNEDEAMTLARQCDQLNRQRKDLCNAIEAEAIALVEAEGATPPPFLMLAQNHWHHGVIGIVAARLMERYFRPTALLAGEGDGRLRASVRAPSGFAVNDSLKACAVHLDRFGGHSAAGGFTIRAEKVGALHEALNKLASNWHATVGGGVSISPETLLKLHEINLDLWNSLQQLEPFGIGHPAPLFWARNCLVVDQHRMRGGHLQLILAQGDCQRRAIAWRWISEAQVPERIDVAFRINMNHWQGEDRLQMEVVALRAYCPEINLHRKDKTYRCLIDKEGQMVLVNPKGEVLKAILSSNGKLKCTDSRARHPYIHNLIEEGLIGLGLRP
ncbi:Single-stranded-DNA-specific exonuclease RecJ [Prochlorococcus marinus str. MIT 1342]|nr:Single-stranded-DNA-specific exonuclease RecJ [Prochlorococcus marinus str. MIT 1342]